MTVRLDSWPALPHPVIAVMLGVAICAVPVVLPHFDLANLGANLFAYCFACVLVYPIAALLRHRVTHVMLLWAIAALLLLAACFYHTNIMADTADALWPQRRDATLAKFLFNLPQMTLGVLGWWILVMRPDRRTPPHPDGDDEVLDPEDNL
ncbi:hypothetical protein ASF61_16575 [Duganella sp. Leaf126]|uniref:hypothetical protein n=1 Tax=Duganella sp. Leaf126 TaxID=1736266 RepID=UPI0006F625CC|nr:hypothetical protein [Duganella sp. Leaf126]KQQ31952.1 hypothetical protein ASF61_16575 [Duganella sp. Leaf126]